MATKDEVVDVLKGEYGLTITEEKPVQNGVQIVAKQVPKVVVYDTANAFPVDLTRI